MKLRDSFGTILKSIGRKMESFVKFLMTFFNLLGLTSLKFDRNSWKTSRSITIRNFFQCLLLFGIKIYLFLFIDISIYMDKGHIYEEFTSFSINIYRLTGAAPMILNFFLVLNHLRKQNKIAKLINWFSKFHEEFSSVSKCGKFSKRYFVVLLICIISIKTLSLFFLFRWNFLVSSLFLAKFYSELFIGMFLFVFIILIEYLIFVLDSFNQSLKTVLQSEGNVAELENLIEIYRRIHESIEKFYEVFHFEIALVLSYFIAKGVLMVSHSSSSTQDYVYL
jgi:hypothetical protein